MRRWWNEIRVRVRALVRRRAMERELEEEMAHHLELETRRLLSEGMEPKEARREAYRRFGGVERYREATRQAWGVRWLDAAVRDARLAMRRMRRSPGSTAVIVVTLALGIGGTTAMFGPVYASLLKALPYPDGDRLVWIASAAMITSENLDDWREGLRSVEELGAFALRSDTYQGHDGARSVSLFAVSDEYLPLLGAEPVLGRLWTPAEGEPGAPPVAVVSHAFWLDELGGAALRGQSVTVGDRSYRVLGVVPPDFHNLGYDHVDAWTTMARASSHFNIVARRKASVTVADVQAEIDALIPRLGAPPDSERFGRRATAQSFRQQFTRTVRTPLLVLLVSAGLVLLLACANVANILSSRATGRSHELTVRSALGAGAGTLVRESLIEGTLLALVGAAAGLLVAQWAIAVVVSFAPPWYGAGMIGGVEIDAMVFAFAAAVTAATVVLSVMGPAAAAARSAGQRSLGASRGAAGSPGGRWRGTLAAGQVALAMVLLVGTTLMVRTYLVLRPASPGYDVENRFVATLTLPGLERLRNGDGLPADSEANRTFVQRLLQELEGGGPAVRAEVVTNVPLSGMVWAADVIDVDGSAVPLVDERVASVWFNAVTPGYTDVMRIPLIQGRPLSDDDASGAPAVVVVNEAAAGRYWPHLDTPVGRRISVNAYGSPIEFTVIGVAADVRSVGSHTRTRPQVYASYWRVPLPRMRIVVHAPPSAGIGEETIRRAVAAIDPSIPVDNVTTLEAIAAESVARPRYEMSMMTAFGILAMVLAVVGCYGVLSCWVGQRRHEIGVRMAIGAAQVAIVRDVLRRAGVLIGMGLVAGTLLALTLTRLLDSMLYGVTATDPIVFAQAAALLAAGSLAAAWVPAWRAGAVDPARTLNAE